MEEYRVIPGYEGYEVNAHGVIRPVRRNEPLYQYVLNGYLAVDTYRGSKTETLPVHRAVALAWVVNPQPGAYTIVNHKDGNPVNNHWYNLEWCNHSMNNYHAVNAGLRQDNYPCRVRDFQTGEVLPFGSLAQAAVYMGLSRDAPVDQLFPKRFGWLINGRYELRLQSDDTPWFYESRVEAIRPSRYRVVATEESGEQREYFTGSELLKAYQLYDSPYGRSVPALAQYAEERVPGLRLEVHDGYTRARDIPVRDVAPSTRRAVVAHKSGERIEFTSLSECARHFNVDRSSIQSRLNTEKELDGWTFT